MVSIGTGMALKPSTLQVSPSDMDLDVRRADPAVSKIAFVSGESLLPMFLLNVTSVVLPTAGRFNSTSVMLQVDFSHLY
jgi:hypothetical protein